MKPLSRTRVVELLEVVARVGRRMERDDDRRLDRGSRNGRKPSSAMPVDERLAVLRVAREPRRLAAFGDELVERRVERDDDVRRRRDSATASSSPCSVHWSCRSSASDVRVAGALLEHALRERTRSPCPGAPFEALARRGDQRVERHRRARRSAARRTSSSRRRSGPCRGARTTAAISAQRIEDAGRRSRSGSGRRA